MTAHPLTITATLTNAGQVGHPEYGRTERISARLMESLYEQARRRQRALGFATLNDYLNYAVLFELQTAQPLAPLTPQPPRPPREEPLVIGEKAAPETAHCTNENAPSTPEEGDPLERFWTYRFAPWMTEKVSAQNFEIWLSSCRFLAVSTARCILEVPNAFFCEYLGEHYQEVIEEALHELVGPDAYLRLQVRPEPKEEPIPAPQAEEPPLTKYDQRIAILMQLRYSTPIYAQYDAIRKQLEAKWRDEDSQEHPLLRQPGDPRRQRQPHQGSAWEPALHPAKYDKLRWEPDP